MDSESDDDIEICQICTELYDDDPDLFVERTEKEQSHLPVQSSTCRHFLCYNCVVRKRMAEAERLSDKAFQKKKWVECPFCKKVTSFNTADPNVSHFVCQMLRRLRRRSKKTVLPSAQNTTDDAIVSGETVSSSASADHAQEEADPSPVTLAVGASSDSAQRGDSDSIGDPKNATGEGEEAVHGADYMVGGYPSDEDHRAKRSPEHMERCEDGQASSRKKCRNDRVSHTILSGTREETLSIADNTANPLPASTTAGSFSHDVSAAAESLLLSALITRRQLFKISGGKDKKRKVPFPNLLDLESPISYCGGPAFATCTKNGAQVLSHLIINERENSATCLPSTSKGTIIVHRRRGKGEVWNDTKRFLDKPITYSFPIFWVPQKQKGTPRVHYIGHWKIDNCTRFEPAKMINETLVCVEFVLSLDSYKESFHRSIEENNN